MISLSSSMRKIDKSREANRPDAVAGQRAKGPPAPPTPQVSTPTPSPKLLRVPPLHGGPVLRSVQRSIRRAFHVPPAPDTPPVRAPVRPAVDVHLVKPELASQSPQHRGLLTDRPQRLPEARAGLAPPIALGAPHLACCVTSLVQLPPVAGPTQESVYAFAHSGHFDLPFTTVDLWSRRDNGAVRRGNSYDRPHP